MERLLKMQMRWIVAQLSVVHSLKVALTCPQKIWNCHCRQGTNQYECVTLCEVTGRSTASRICCLQQLRVKLWR